MATILINKTSGLFGLVGAISGPLKNSPHLVYLGVTIALNAQPVIRGIFPGGDPYHGNPTWLIANAVCSLAHILVAAYIVNKIMKKGGETGESTAAADDEYSNMESEEKPKTFMEAIEDAVSPVSQRTVTPAVKLYRLMMHDKFFAVYLVVLMAWMLIVLPYGISLLRDWAFSSSLLWSILCGYLYIVIGVVVFGYFLFSKLNK